MSSADIPQIVLVTGASGFVASHIIQNLLERGYRVRGSVRSLQNEAKVRPIRELHVGSKHPVELVEAELLNADSWTEAAQGCRYVIHAASPVVVADQSDEEGSYIKPAVEGTVNVLRAAKQAGTVKRVVITSSVNVTIGSFETEPGRTYKEDDTPDPFTETKYAYPKSKARAEKAALDFVRDHDVTFDVVLLRLGMTVGPFTASLPVPAMFLRDFFSDNKSPFFSYCCPVIDARDAAAAHVNAMTAGLGDVTKITLGTRAMWMGEYEAILRAEFEKQGYNISSFGTPDLERPVFEMTRMRDLLKVEPRPIEEGALHMVYDMIESGAMHKTDKYTGHRFDDGSRKFSTVETSCFRKM